MIWWWLQTPYTRLRAAQRENKALTQMYEITVAAYEDLKERCCRMERENEVLARQVKELQFMLREEEPDE